MRLEVQGAVVGGHVIARSRDGVFFVSGAIPGEIVEVEETGRRKGARWAAVRSVIRPSADRVAARCSVFGTCGGCHFQFIGHARQVAMKQEALVDCLRRIGGIDMSLDPPLAGRAWEYRKRARLKVGPGGEIGFYGARTHEVIRFEQCHLLSPELSAFIARAGGAGPALEGAELLVQSGEDPRVIVACVRGRPADRRAAEGRLKEAGASGVFFPGRRPEDAPRTLLKAGRIDYHVSAGTFFQANWELNTGLVDLIAGCAGRIEPDAVIDLFAGAGNFSLAAARAAKRVVAVEESPMACRDGARNAALAGLRNVVFVESRVGDFDIPRKAGLLILDPPRGGLSGGLVKKILGAAPGVIVYVSCNPSTFARDAGDLSGRYALRSVRLVDMFPQTCHMEVLGIMEPRG
ncbi:MAG: RsmD family RNA methyltransferase [Pseudomonadota bacterium]